MFCFFFTNDPATTAIYTLSLHDALPICLGLPYTGTRAQRTGLRSFTSNQIGYFVSAVSLKPDDVTQWRVSIEAPRRRSEEHTSELQSRENLVCRLLLEKKNNYK